MRELFSFPNPVNETSARLVAGAVAVLALLTIAFQQGWLIPVLAYGFVARTLTGPEAEPARARRDARRHAAAARVAPVLARAREALRSGDRCGLHRRRDDPLLRRRPAHRRVRARRRDRGLRVARGGVRPLRRLQGVLPRHAARARAAVDVRGLCSHSRRRPPRSLPSCSSRWSRFRTSRRGATRRDRRHRRGARRPRDAARRPHRRRPQPLGVHARRRRARSSSTRCSPASNARASGSTCARTPARIRGSARPTSCRSCRFVRRTWSVHG